MLKRLLLSMLVIGLMVGLGQVQVSADKGYDAVITIDANKHTFDNMARLSIGMSSYGGYWNDDQKLFIIMGGEYTGVVTNGQIIGSGSERVLVKTVAKKAQPKPEPKPEPKPQPKPKPKRSEERRVGKKGRE